MPADSSTTATTQVRPAAADAADTTSDDTQAHAAAAPSASQREAKRLWTTAEDQQLVAVVGKYGASRWSLIATHVPGRAGKQCRERWFNHLCPEVKKGDWSAEEDETLLRAVAELGSQWSIIVKRMPGRTDNAIKNRYNTIQRRARSAQHSCAADRGDRAPRWPAGAALSGRSPDGASPGSNSETGSAATPKRRRGDGGQGVEAADDAFALDCADPEDADGDAGATVEEVFGALLADMPTPSADAAEAAMDAAAAQQRRRERATELAAELAACDPSEPKDHARIDALLDLLGQQQQQQQGRGDRHPDAASLLEQLAAALPQGYLHQGRRKSSRVRASAWTLTRLFPRPSAAPLNPRPRGLALTRLPSAPAPAFSLPSPPAAARRPSRRRPPSSSARTRTARTWTGTHAWTRRRPTALTAADAPPRPLGPKRPASCVAPSPSTPTPPRRGARRRARAVPLPSAAARRALAPPSPWPPWSSTTTTRTPAVPPTRAARPSARAVAVRRARLLSIA